MSKFHLSVFGIKKDQLSPEILKVADSVSFYDYDPEKMMEPLDPTPQIILCFPSESEISPLEIAQTLRMNYPELGLFWIANNKNDFDKKKLIKNGFSQAYLLPWEKADFFRAIKEEAIYTSVPALRDYKPVKVVDLQPGTKLDFGLKIFMPLNNKFLQFAEEGVEIPAEKLEKLQENAFNTLFIHKDDIEEFRNYTVGLFKNLLRKTAISETEKQEKLEKGVRDLLSDMFIQDTKENTFGKSSELLKEVKEIINVLVKEENLDVVTKINNLVNQENNFYLHLSNVSTFAGLFAMIIGLPKPEEVALAGLLHDLGKINLPSELIELEEHEMGPHAMEAYKKHPQYTLDVAKSKKMVIPDNVAKAILQHHEKMNGTGYPKGLEGSRITMEARVLAIADQFDYLTSVKPGKKSMTMSEALNFMCDENSKDPGRMVLDLDLLIKLKQALVR